MSKRALLAGCNYPGSSCSLRGCINDVKTMQYLLTTYFGFSNSEITIMIDTDSNYTKPTGANIKGKLSEMVSQSQAGDVLFFHFSGHGTQVPTPPETGEADGKDEAFCPTDMNLILDDDMKAIFGGLNPECKFTWVADCCHSGTMLDHPDLDIISGPKDGSPQPPPPQMDVQALAGLFGLKELDMGSDLKNRAIPFDQVAEQLSKLLGFPVNANNAHTAMRDLFGNAASAKTLNYVAMGMQLLNSNPMAKSIATAALTKAGLGGCLGGAGGGMLMGLLPMLCGAGAGGGTGATEPTLAQPGGQAAGNKVNVPDAMPDKVGILISGCQSNETSADACPSGDANKAFGALTNAIRGVVEAHFQTQPDQPLTYRNLVIAVRDSLKKGNFAQNPTLECDASWADTSFITIHPVKPPNGGNAWQ